MKAEHRHPEIKTLRRQLGTMVKEHNEQIAELVRQISGARIREAFWRESAERLATRLKTFQHRSEGLNSQDFAVLKDYDFTVKFLGPARNSLQRPETNPNPKP